jgi:hypothetical protein
VDEDSDTVAYYTLAYGFDSLAQAQLAIPRLAKENRVSEDELCVVRTYSNGERE